MSSHAPHAPHGFMDNPKKIDLVFKLSARDILDKYEKLEKADKALKIAKMKQDKHECCNLRADIRMLKNAPIPYLVNLKSKALRENSDAPVSTRPIALSKRNIPISGKEKEKDKDKDKEVRRLSKRHKKDTS